MTRFHEQLKTPTTRSHDVLCGELIEQLLKKDGRFIKESYYPKSVHKNVRVEVTTEAMVREELRAAPIGYVDVLVSAIRDASDDDYGYAHFAVEVKSSNESIGGAIRQLKTYEKGWVKNTPITKYGVVEYFDARCFPQITNMVLCMPNMTCVDKTVMTLCKAAAVDVWIISPKLQLVPR